MNTLFPLRLWLVDIRGAYIQSVPINMQIIRLATTRMVKNGQREGVDTFEVNIWNIRGR